MIDVVFSDSFAMTLKQYYKQRRIDRRVLSMPMYLSIGDISQHSFVESRKTVYKIQYAHTRESERNTAEAVMHLRKALRALNSGLDMGEPIRIWWSGNADDYCGFLWLCDYLFDYDIVTTSIHLPMAFATLGNELLTISGLGEISALGIDELELFSYESKLSKTQRNAYRYYWQQLRGENNPIRTIINGLAVSQSIDFYDRFIIANLSQQRYRNVMRVIGETLGNYPFVPSWWYRHRIDYLVSKGSIAFKPDEHEVVGLSVGKIKLTV